MTDKEIYAALRRSRLPGESRLARARRLGVPWSSLQRWEEQRPPLREGTRLLLIRRLGLETTPCAG